MDAFFLEHVSGAKPGWAEMSRAEKQLALRREQQQTLRAFLDRGAISRSQYEQGLRALQGQGETA